MRKDLAIVRDEARRLQLDLPVMELVDGFYADVQNMGGSRWDTSSLFARMQARSGAPSQPDGKAAADEANGRETQD